MRQAVVFAESGEPNFNCWCPNQATLPWVLQSWSFLEEPTVTVYIGDGVFWQRRDGLLRYFGVEEKVNDRIRNQ
jgi:hypothetical protein